MEKAVVIVEEKKSIKESLKETILALKSMYPQLEKVSDEEILKALLYCKKAKLDPFKREVHFIPYGKSLQVVTSYTEYIKRGEKSGKLDGWTVKVEGETKNDLRATIIIYRKDWSRPFEWTVYFREVAKNSPTWEAMPIFMLKKAAISQAFRLAFPEETGFLPGEEAEIAIEETEMIVEPESTEPVEQTKKMEKAEKASFSPQGQDRPDEVAEEKEKKEPEKIIPDGISKESREKLEKQINQGQINIIVKELTKTLGLKEDDPVFKAVENLNYEQAVEALKKIREKKHREVYEELLKLTGTKDSAKGKEEKTDKIEDIEDLFEYEEDEEIPF